MNGKQIFQEIGFLDDKLIEEADTITKKQTHHKTWLKAMSFAACFALIIAVGVYVYFNQSSQIPLSDFSEKARVKYVKTVPGSIRQRADLVPLTEEEIFSHFNSAIVKGNIVNLSNIEINMNGEKEYRAIAEIQVEKVYRGKVAQGDTISILLPCPIMDDIWVEDTDTVSAMRVGQTGIFMPIKYDEHSLYESNGATLVLSDIAEYGFPDGSRFAFVQTNDGLVFSKWDFPSIENATDLEEIEHYIENKMH
jgi:hypothetical protein